MVIAFTLLTASACERPATGPHHPVDQLDYPVAVTADPSGEIVWVTSGNFDLAWRGGAVLAIDVKDHSFLTAESDEGDVPVGAEIGSFPGPLELLERDGRAVAGLGRRAQRRDAERRREDEPPLLEVLAVGADDAAGARRLHRRRVRGVAHNSAASATRKPRPRCPRCRRHCLAAEAVV